MATFSDLMALLLTFFVLLFSFSTMDAGRWASIVSAFTGSFSILPGSGLLPAPDLSAMMHRPEEIYLPSDITEDAMDSGAASEWELVFDRINLFAVEAGGISGVTVTGNQEFITLRLEDALLFESGLANLRSDSLPMLARLWDVIRDSMHIIGEVRVEGHTCNLPLRQPNVQGFQDNLDLSAARALRVARYFLSVGMDPAKVEPVGKSEYWPIATNDTLEGRAANRRVDIVLVRDQSRRPVHHVDEITRPFW
jgi:chemotaxis protein MotB